MSSFFKRNGYKLKLTLTRNDEKIITYYKSKKAMKDFTALYEVSGWEFSKVEHLSEPVPVPANVDWGSFLEELETV